MHSPENAKPIGHFLPRLLSDPYFEEAARRYSAVDADLIIEAARRGDVDAISALGVEIEDLIHDESVIASQDYRAGRDDDPFDITVYQFGPVFWVSANEFEDAGYFESLDEAELYVSWEFICFASSDEEEEEEVEPRPAAPFGRAAASEDPSSPASGRAQEEAQRAATGFTIVWQPFDDVSPTGRPLRDRVWFPYLVDGSEHEALVRDGTCDLTYKALLYGISVAHGKESALCRPPETRQYMETLADLATGFRSASVEGMLLSVAANLRTAHGDQLAHRALETAQRMLPNSAMIRSDLITSCWALLKDGDSPTEDLLRKIDHFYREQDLPGLHPVAAINVVYLKLLATSLLPDRRYTRDLLVRSGVLTMLNDPWYRQRVKYLFSEPRPLLSRSL